MTLFEIFDQLEQTALGSAIRDSVWLFPAIEAVHLLGLAMLGGSVLLVDLRLLGAGVRSKSAAELLEQAHPWFAGALALMFATGIPLFLSEAVKCYFNPSFWVKMSALATAIAFTWLLRNRVVRRATLSAGSARLLGASSIGLWLTVAAAGRWIGFS